MTLRLRLTLFYGAFFAFVVSAVAVSVFVLTERSLIATLEDRARQALVDLSSGAVLEGLSKLPGDAYYEVVIIGREGIVTDDVDDVRNGVPYVEPARVRPNPTADGIVEALTDEDLARLIADGDMTATVTLTGGDALRVLGDLGALSFPSQGVTLSAALFVGVSATQVESTLDELSRNLGVTVLLAFVGFATGVFLLSREVLRPLERVTQAAARVTSRDLSQRVPVPSSDDEMRDMVVTLNRMLDRLQDSFETQRRFTADASHELRTPVTAIVGHANYLLRRTKPSAEQVDSLHVIRHEAERMGKLVSDLLELARADAGLLVQREPTDLVPLLETVHMEIAPMAGDSRVEVDVPGHPVVVDGDAVRLKQVLLNLLHNALQAGARTVRLSLSETRGTVHLEVLDDGPGIPADALPHLFERFYRVDGARSTRGNGSGLGLSIVQWIVRQHGGTVEVTSRPGEGTLFTVTLPTVTLPTVASSAGPPARGPRVAAAEPPPGA